jgi:hypothetical protein
VAFFNDHLNLRFKHASKWEAAIQKKYNSFMANGTWELTNIPKDCKIVGCKWVICTKRNSSGEIVMLKAKLVAK